MRIFGRQVVGHLFPTKDDQTYKAGTAIVTHCGVTKTLTRDVKPGEESHQGWVSCSRCMIILLREYNLRGYTHNDLLERYRDLINEFNDLAREHNDLLKDAS